MADKKDENYFRKLANATLLILISRVSVPLIAAVAMWMASSISEMEKSVATLMAALPAEIKTVEAKIDGVDKRTSNLEGWRNNFDAFASDEKPHKRGGI